MAGEHDRPAPAAQLIRQVADGGVVEVVGRSCRGAAPSRPRQEKEGRDRDLELAACSPHEGAGPGDGVDPEPGEPPPRCGRRCPARPASAQPSRRRRWRSLQLRAPGSAAAASSELALDGAHARDRRVEQGRPPCRRGRAAPPATAGRSPTRRETSPASRAPRHRRGCATQRRRLPAPFLLRSGRGVPRRAPRA